MDISLMVVLVISVGLIIMGVIILIGRGDMLISGYNTASVEKKTQYNIGRLRKVTAILLFVIALMCPFYYYFIAHADSDDLAIMMSTVVFTVVIVIVVIVGVIIMNTYCKIK